MTLPRIVVLAVLVLTASSCGRSFTTYAYTWRYEGTWTEIRWEETTFSTSRLTSAHVVIPDGSTPVGELIEVYQDGVDLELRGELRRDASLVPIGADARADIVEYDLSGLSAGSYVVVHRRSSQTPGAPSNLPLSGWGNFDGEDALINHLNVGTAP